MDFSQREEGKQASFTWLVQRWRGMAAPDNIWGPSIMAAAAAQHQAAAAAAAEAAAAAAASRAKAVSSKSHPASSGTTIREELAAAGNMCIDCGTQQSPAWRRFEGAILCNKCWCRAKAAKMKGGRHACAAASLMRRSERTGKAHADSPAAAPATATDVRYVTRASVVRPDGQEAVQGTCSGAENGARASADKRAAVPAENAAEEPSTEARALREDPGATPAAEPALEQSARASAAETEAASAEAAAVGVSPEASAHIEDRAATPPAEPAAEEQSVPASAAETGGAAAEIANSIEASLPEESTAATPGAEPAMEEQSVLARAAETAAVQTSTQASVPEESAAAIPAPESALQETMHSDADEGAATVPTEPPVVQRITRASKSRAESQAAALESAFQRTTRSGIKRVDVPSQPHRWPPTAAKKATAAATPAAEPALQRSTRSGTAKAAAVPAPVSAMRPRTRAGNAQVESAAPTPPSESSLQRRLRSGIRKVYFLAEESGQPSSAAGEASAAAAPAVESALQNSKHADDATHPPVARDTRARRPPQTERVVVESAAESAPQHSMRTSSAPKAGAAIAPGAASSQQPCRPARTASINDMAPIAALGTAAVPSGPAKMLVERARRIHRHANIASLAAASSSAVAPSPAPSLAAEPPLPMRAVKLAAARVWQEDSAPVPAQEPAPPRVERARRIHRHPSAAGIAGARSTVAASSLAAGPPLPERAAKLAAARTWQGMTPAGVMPHKRKATMRLAPPPPRATALAVEQARRIHRRAPSSAGPPASASRAERRPAAKRRLPPQAPAAAAQVAEAAQAPEATMQEAEAAAPREKRQRRITLRMQEAMEDPGPHMGLRAVADTGACDAAPADGEQPPEGQHEEVQGPGSDVTGALKQREEESTAAAAESAAEADAAPAGQLDGQLGTASKAAAAAIVGRRRPCIAERPPQTGTRLKNWMHATGGVKVPAVWDWSDAHVAQS
ncbi:hypothetical protein COCSUDRAFT_64253 [Coccomyxa subellipsoidea C-169]|uniref:GATA-type domain-containing protein n=1 Tax=Coccomyxa subellipsoidea (strain C-169) TaxID=574566 RepID=I0ZA16_COCSC|nr:hypothetical protein COCSUDRAFT_64253 [Coccomyxa subellipsoidea C-169]EIE27485.1 hypothetical protein COCSUDRAFT_64253 [Coccomyxa subellipsoidea C-169]|eukprot:XP_005652029.1 hypothetical protein COCSUDRAFT_64253 [Coccomyxa subellipsoidea C-169]